jgi:hypothetical protein
MDEKTMAIAKPMARAKDGDMFVDGYMCAIDWNCELGAAADGNKVYPSVEALRKEHNMADECGIVKVRVSFLEVIEEGTTL